VGFQPIGYRISVGQKFGITDTVDHVSVGGSDGIRQHVISHLNNGTVRRTFTLSGKVVSHYEVIGGNPTEILSASHDSMQPTGPRVNVTIPNTSYQIVLEAWN
jgi:hypothetical protein